MTSDPTAALAPHFAPEVLAQSRELLGRRRIVIRYQDRQRTVAMVPGSRQRPYRTEVRLECGRDGALVAVHGTCGCSVGHRCKHVAAVASLALAGAEPTAVAAAEGEQVMAWAQALVGREGAANAAPSGKRATRQLRFIIEPDSDGASPPVVYTVGVTAGRNGPTRERAVDLDALSRANKSWLGVTEQLLYQELRLREQASYGYGHLSPRLPADETGPELLRRLVESGRAHLGSVRAPALSWHQPKRASVGWHIDHRGTQTPALLGLPPSTRILALRPPHWVDPKSGHCGPIATGLSPVAAQALLVAPALSVEAAQTLAADGWPEDSGVAPPRTLALTRLPATAAVAVLELTGDRHGSCARLSFRYHEAICDPDEPYDDASIVSEATTIVRVPRDRAAEAALAARLAATGLSANEVLEPDADVRWPSRWMFADREDPTADEEAWLNFASHDMPALVAEGWDVQREPSFRWALSVVDAWTIEAEEQDEGDWFALSVGVEIEGERIAVLPAVVHALSKGHLDATQVPERGVILELAPGHRVRMPADRLRSILSVLLELFGHRPLTAAGAIVLPRAAAARLVEIDPKSDLRWHGPARLRRLAQTIAAAGTGQLARTKTPAALRATLRDYQTVGLSWLQFLRRLALGGILADDMGLGKTVQTLAHLLVERRAGRLDRPCLVVAPTSVLTVWCDEAARFAPSLSLLLHYGPGRSKDIEQLAGHDVIVTSYALLHRDIELLASVPMHVAVLDEAHAIKNPATKVAAAARRLNARTRLCLTGTPLENNLTELWALMDFVMPGLLGTPRRFATAFARPIEQDGDAARQKALIDRIAPFVLRRTKQQVLPQLPPKTEQVRYAELSRAQRDLYEAVRLGALTDVRKAIANKGLARSQIGVFEALLKLREVCCDPRLVPYASARKVTDSAKLELAMGLVSELVAAGRRILIFSQFTRMLELLGQALDERDISWLKLTGRTRKRAEVVARFEEGETPVFLISLKAGGTGLNLTAADTVIHYDPWWNPAAQDQATDRAHRIGQTQPVLVLSLVARGTVEERMLELQAGKRALADGVIGEAASRGKRRGMSLDADVVEALLSPLPTEC